MIKENEIYKHYRTQDLYKVLFVCPFNCNRSKELDEKTIVVYQNIENEKVWTRLEEEFFDEIELEGKKVRRFELIN